MLITTEEGIERFHDSQWQLTMVLSGGGSRGISSLLEIPGGSQTILEVQIPYSSRAMEFYLGFSPLSYCSSATARALALKAFNRAKEISLSIRTNEKTAGETNSTDVRRRAGLSCTASLVSNHPKKGAHRIHLAWQDDSSTCFSSLDLLKGRRSRREEEQLAGLFLVHALLAWSKVVDPSLLPPLPLLETEAIRETVFTPPSAWIDLMQGKIFWTPALSEPLEKKPENLLLFPGAFHPLHEAHRRIAEIAEDKLKKKVYFELSLVNVDKPPLDYWEMNERFEGLRDRRLLFTRAESFQKKAELFPHSTFILGSDTLKRIADIRYYSNATEQENALRSIILHGSHFLLFCREGKNGVIRLADISLPDYFRERCSEVPPEEFLMPLSSTEIRGEHPEE